MIDICWKEKREEEKADTADRETSLIWPFLPLIKAVVWYIASKNEAIRVLFVSIDFLHIVILAIVESTNGNISVYILTNALLRVAH